MKNVVVLWCGRKAVMAFLWLVQDIQIASSQQTNIMLIGHYMMGGLQTYEVFPGDRVPIVLS